MNFSRNGNSPDHESNIGVQDAPEQLPLAPPVESAIPEPDGHSEFVTRASVKAKEGVSKQKLLLLGGGLGIAVLFFIFTAVVGKTKKAGVAKAGVQHTQQTTTAKPSGSITPMMSTSKVMNQDDTSGQVAPGDILKTRTVDPTGASLSKSDKPAALSTASAGPSTPAGSLGSVPSFAQTQQRWEDPAPFGNANTDAGADNSTQSTQERNALKEASLVFVRPPAQTSAAPSGGLKAVEAADAPLLQITPGTRIQAKLETQISSAVSSPVVAVVEYTYAIGNQVVVPAGARVYGQLQQADRSGLVSVKFDEIELLDHQRERIDAVGTGLDLGPIKGDVYGKNTGKNILVRTLSGIGSVAAELAGNNSSAAFSEDDMLRERLAENIGTTGDSEIMSLNANSRIVVSVPADTKIYVVFTKHQDSASELHKVVSTSN